ncbi:DegT/DnrJ/EryC1/StrS family aminotransferase, partial [Alphaproteobacteria bacterium]|nr:DegT/DnrJ/EryC1/StrS family aminotransferase [Alphaproteobacteria bacterium]
MQIKKIIKSWPETNTIGKEEIKAANKVLKSGKLSGFRASPNQEFFGGSKVIELEKNWKKKFKVKHAISFNSWTSGLIASVGAIGIEPGDEVICPPITMEASSTCLLFYGAVPVFADVDKKTMCIDPKQIEKKITKKTKAIMVVHIFGQPANMKEILKISKKYKLKVIEDAAQSPLGKFNNRYLGTIGDVGGFSLNYHKTIHCGEGGIVVTNNDNIATRLKLIRNHGECVVDKFKIALKGNIFGGNFRMNEIEAAIANEQLKKLTFLTKYRKNLAKYLIRKLKRFNFLNLPDFDENGNSHVFYFFVMQFDKTKINIPRHKFVKACQSLGLNIRKDYCNPAYYNSMYLKNNFFPINNKIFKKQNYKIGLCPVAEDILKNRILFGKFCRWP